MLSSALSAFFQSSASIHMHASVTLTVSTVKGKKNLTLSTPTPSPDTCVFPKFHGYIYVFSFIIPLVGKKQLNK